MKLFKFVGMLIHSAFELSLLKGSWPYSSLNHQHTLDVMIIINPMIWNNWVIAEASIYLSLSFNNNFLQR
jgi:hypothetical protein